jgi:4-hydroxy-tetrahydrodipicolinate synthase
MHQLSGVYAAAVTPLKPDFSPDPESLPLLLDFLARRGCHGALLLGSTGEGPSFSTAERAVLFQSAAQWRDAHPTFRLMAGTGSPSLTETVELNRLAFNLNFDAVVSLPPYYYRKATDDGLFSWFDEVIRRSVPSDGALLGYHFPGAAGIGFSLPLLERLKGSFPMQFAGIKDSSHDAELAERLGQVFGADLLVLTGTDSYLSLALENQAGGCITAPANLISPALREVWDLSQAGQDTAAAQKRVTEQRHLLEQYPPFPPLLKALLHRLHGLPRWPVRPPLESVAPEIEERLASQLREISQA